MGPVIWKYLWKMGLLVKKNIRYPFLPKWPLKMGRGFHPVQTKSEYPPPIVAATILSVMYGGRGAIYCMSWLF